MLILSLTAVARGEVSVQGEIAAGDDLWEGTDLVLTEPLRGQLVAREVGEGVLVRGRISTTVQLQCRRCLEPVPYSVDDSVNLLFEPLADQDEEAALSGEVYPLPPRGDVLDLGPVLREQVLLRVPEHVVCRESCRGLCPQCGANLNEAACSCAPSREPGPWDALKTMKFD